MMKKALILGGTGAMGGYLQTLLSQNDSWEVYVTTRAQRDDYRNIHFIQGNARDEIFRKRLLRDNYFSVIVDFMNYGYSEFDACHKELLNATDHYVFLSSSRVYADSQTPITENSPRLLDVSEDREFLATQRYALRKARQENMLCNSNCRNYTIIRPYITYSDRRLQLGVYEKEQWLYRLLNNKPLVIQRNILYKRTTLTYGEDVSRVFCNVMEQGPLCAPIHITTKETMTWMEILGLYLRVIKRETGKTPIIYTTEKMDEIECLFEGGYNTKYDRLYDRFFDNAKAENLYGHVDYMDMRTGLEKCLVKFINDWKCRGNQIFSNILWDYEGMMDCVVGVENPPEDITDKDLYYSGFEHGSDICIHLQCYSNDE